MERRRGVSSFVTVPSSDLAVCRWRVSPTATGRVLLSVFFQCCERGVGDPGDDGAWDLVVPCSARMSSSLYPGIKRHACRASSLRRPVRKRATPPAHETGATGSSAILATSVVRDGDGPAFLGPRGLIQQRSTCWVVCRGGVCGGGGVRPRLWFYGARGDDAFLTRERRGHESTGFLLRQCVLAPDPARGENSFTFAQG